VQQWFLLQRHDHRPHDSERDPVGEPELRREGGAGMHRLRPRSGRIRVRGALIAASLPASGERLTDDKPDLIARPQAAGTTQS
jgi:hypothetical protein